MLKELLTKIPVHKDRTVEIVLLGLDGAKQDIPSPSPNTPTAETLDEKVRWVKWALDRAQKNLERYSFEFFLEAFPALCRRVGLLGEAYLLATDVAEEVYTSDESHLVWDSWSNALAIQGGTSLNRIDRVGGIPALGVVMDHLEARVAQDPELLEILKRLAAEDDEDNE